MRSNVVIFNRKDASKMKAWEKIFFMFLDTKKSFNTLTDIAEATTEHYSLEPKMNQGTISKSLGILQGAIVYDGKSYTVRKMIKQDINGRDTEELCYKLITETEIERLWYEGKNKLEEGKYLVEGKLCAISKYVYVFKLNKKTRKKDQLAEDQLNNVSPNTQKIKIKIKKVKEIFSNMILLDFLYDISYFDGNIVVMLNSQNTKSKTNYSKLLEEFWLKP